MEEMVNAIYYLLLDLCGVDIIKHKDCMGAAQRYILYSAEIIRPWIVKDAFVCYDFNN